MITVTVPATSANVGAGFDSLGLALSMHNVFTFEECDRIRISSVDGTHVPTGANNLVYRSARAVYDQLGIPLRGLRITQRNDIPMARGLGSSSACIVAGILGANALLGNKLTSRQMLTLATAIEGHPDNVAPAMLGGFVTSVYDEGQVYSVKKNIDEQLAFAAFVPDFRLLTSKRAPRCRIWSAIRTPCIICPAPRWLPPRSAMAITACLAWQPRIPCTRNTACP
nr:homoserine kinase [Gemmiger qucibialis]